MMAMDYRKLGARLAVAGVLALSLAVPASAQPSSQPWTEALYNPPVGSRWIVTSQSVSDEQRPDGARQNKTLSRFELTIEEKTATGYRISYVNRALEVEGNAPGLKVVAPAFTGATEGAGAGHRWSPRIAQSSSRILGKSPET